MDIDTAAPTKSSTKLVTELIYDVSDGKDITTFHSGSGGIGDITQRLKATSYARGGSKSELEMVMRFGVAEKGTRHVTSTSGAATRHVYTTSK